MSVFEILEEIMKERELSVADVSRICNIPDSTVRAIIRRKQESIALEVAFKISDGLGVSLEKLNGLPEKDLPRPQKSKTPSMSDEAMKLADDYDHNMDKRGRETVRGVADMEVERYKAREAMRKQRSQMEAAEEITRFIVPGYSMPMSAGTGQTAGEGEYPENYALIKEPPRGTSFIAPVSGYSMEPTFHDGDKLFIHSCTEIRPGQIGVFIMDGQQWVKELGEGVLISHNPGYDPISLMDGVECQGLVLGVCDESYFE